MTPEQEPLFLTRAKQCLAHIDVFLRDLGKPVPQSLRDAVEALRETVEPKTPSET
jgi:hypothetical protein